jgi:hypothetical protein
MISKPIFKDQTHTYSRIIESAIENDLLDSLEKTKELTIKLIEEIPRWRECPTRAYYLVASCHFTILYYL